MLPHRGGGVRGKSRGRGGVLRGTASATSEPRARNDPRKVHFAAQDGTSTPPSSPRGRGKDTPRGTQVLGRDPGRIHAALSKTFDKKSKPSTPSIQPGQGTFQQRYQVLKNNRDTERADAIANGFLADPDRPRTLAEAITPVGTCQDMCAEFERLERITQNDVWGPETDPGNRRLPDESRMVKKFRRAAAGIDEQLPSDLRPPPILQKTLNYLFSDVIGQSSELAKVHHFVWDRTRAIRNDFSIQQVSKLADLRITIDSYERIARFHILSLHQLALPQKPYDKYDSQQEREQLDKTLLSLMQLYDDSRGRLESPNEAEFRAYCIIFQIQDPVPDLEDRVQAWPKHIFQDARVQRALRLYAAASNTFDDQGPLKPRTPHPIAQANCRRFWQIIKSNEISYLMACVAEIYFSLVRRIALNSIWQSYRLGQNKKTEDWTLTELADALGLEDEEEVRDFCGNYGFAIEDRPDGTAFIDLNSVNGKTLPYAVSGTQGQSRSALVEVKRHHRTFPAIINGLSVRAAQAAGLVEAASGQDAMEEDRPQNDSLFIRDSDEEESGRFASDNKKSSKQKGLTQSPLNPVAANFSPGHATATEVQPFSSFQAPSLPSNDQAKTANLTGLGKSGTATNTFSTSTVPPTLAFNPFGTKQTQSRAPGVTSKTIPPITQTTPLPPFSPFGGSQILQTTSSESSAPHTSNETSFVKSSTPVPPFGGFTFSPNGGTNTFNPSQKTSQSPLDQVSHKTFSSLPEFRPSALFPSQSTQPPTGSDTTKIQTSEPSISMPGANPFKWPAVPPTSSANPLTVPSTVLSPFALSSSGNASNPASSPSFPTSSTQPAVGAAPLQQASTSRRPGLNFPLASVEDAPLSPVSQPPLTSQPVTASPLSNPTSLFPTSKLSTSGSQNKPESGAFASPPQRVTSQSETTQAKPKRSAAAIAASKARSSKALTQYARTLVEEKYGLLEQYIEFMTLPLIRAARDKIEADELRQEADDFRYDTLAYRYGTRWREVCWNRRLSREGRERRRRLAKEMEARARHSRESSILSQMEAFREKVASSQSSTAASPAPEQSSKERDAGHQKHRSGSRSPPRERAHSTRQATATSENSRSHLEESFPTAPLTSSDRSDPGRFHASTSSFGSSWSSLRASARRNDTTRSTYFRLKAMGLDPNSDTLFSSTATSRKRSQSDDFETSPTTFKKPLLHREQPMEPATDASQLSGSTSRKSAITAEDEELFAAARAAREAMSESIHFYKEEIAKQESTPPKADLRPTTMLDGTTSQDWYRASTTSLSSSTSKAPPLKYRDRVSKFLPRERYADVLKQQNKSVLGRSWPRPRPSAPTPTPIPDSQTVAADHLEPVVDRHAGNPGRSSHEQEMIPAALEELRKSRPDNRKERVAAQLQSQDNPSPPVDSQPSINGGRLSMEEETGQEGGETNREEMDANYDVDYDDDDDEDEVPYHPSQRLDDNRLRNMAKEAEENGEDDMDQTEHGNLYRDDGNRFNMFADEAQDDIEDDEDETEYQVPQQTHGNRFNVIAEEAEADVENNDDENEAKYQAPSRTDGNRFSAIAEQDDDVEEDEEDEEDELSYATSRPIESNGNKFTTPVEGPGDDEPDTIQHHVPLPQSSSNTNRFAGISQAQHANEDENEDVDGTDEEEDEDEGEEDVDEGDYDHDHNHYQNINNSYDYNHNHDRNHNRNHDDDQGYSDEYDESDEEDGVDGEEDDGEEVGDEDGDENQRAPVSQRQPSGQGWVGKSGASVEEAIEL